MRAGLIDDERVVLPNKQSRNERRRDLACSCLSDASGTSGGGLWILQYARLSEVKSLARESRQLLGCEHLLQGGAWSPARREDVECRFRNDDSCLRWRRLGHRCGEAASTRNLKGARDWSTANRDLDARDANGRSSSTKTCEPGLCADDHCPGARWREQGG